MNPQLAQALLANSGLAPTALLLKGGHTLYEISKAVRTGELIRVARGWVATPAASQVAVTAVLQRGKLTGSSALSSMFVWNAADTRVHVLIPPNSPHGLTPLSPLDAFTRPTFMDGPLVKHWGTERFPHPADPPWRVSVQDALITVADTAPPEHFVACIDSALFKRVLNPSVLATLRSHLPRRMRRYLQYADGRAESGLESIVRLLISPFVDTIEIQVPISGLGPNGGTGRLDILINGWLNIELDGLEYHTTSADHRRDAYLVGLGYRVHRFGYLQVIHHWPTVQATILELLRHPPAQMPRQARSRR